MLQNTNTNQLEVELKVEIGFRLQLESHTTRGDRYCPEKWKYFTHKHCLCFVFSFFFVFATLECSGWWRGQERWWHSAQELFPESWTGGDTELGDREPVFDIDDKDGGYNQTWDLSKILHCRIFRPKILHYKFYWISTVLVIKTQNNECFLRSLHRWQQFYTQVSTSSLAS